MPLVRTPAQVAARTVWLRVACSTAYGPRPHRRLQTGLMHYLRGTGITPCVLPTRIGLFGTGRPITPHDWSAVIGWLLGQPEVVLVHREFPRTSRHKVTQCEAARTTAQSATGTRPEEASPVPWIDPRPDIDPQEVIWHIEDVWLRLAVCVPVCIEVVPGYEDQPILRFEGMSTAHFDEDLEKAALDPAHYRWRVAGRSASFVEAIDVEDDDVLVRLTPMRVVRTWERGPGLVCGMLAVVERVKGLISQG